LRPPYGRLSLNLKDRNSETDGKNIYNFIHHTMTAKKKQSEQTASKKRKLG